MIKMYVLPKNELGQRTVLKNIKSMVNVDGIDVVEFNIGDQYKGPKGTITIRDDSYQIYNNKEIPNDRLALAFLAGQLTKI